MKINAAERGRARRIAMQAIYQWQVTQNPLHVIEAQCHTENDMSKVDTEYFAALFNGTMKQIHEVDEQFKPHLGLAFEKLDPVTLAILRLANFELLSRIDVPYRVVINEALNLAKKYGAADSHKFINGVLDKAAMKVRQAEINAAKNG